MHPSVMIFDFDGTIADTHHYMVEICNRLAPEYGYDPIPPEDVEQLRDRSARELIEHLRVPIVKIPAIITKAKRLFHEGIEGVKLIEGMHDVLHELHRRGVQLGILSSNDQKNIETFLRNHDIHVFDFTYSARTIWGKHHSLKKLMRRHHFDAADVLYIGDESRDIVSARHSRTTSVAVAWGCNSREHLAEESPDHLLTDPRELLELCG
jgi:phosphoglycolate phosphatase